MKKFGSFALAFTIFGIIGSIAAPITYAQTTSYCNFTVCDGTCIGDSYCIKNPPIAANAKPPTTGVLGFYVSRIYKFIMPIAGIIGFLLFMYSGVQYLTSKGDPKAVMAAKLRLTYTFGGLVILFLAYAIFTTVLNLFGLTTN